MTEIVLPPGLNRPDFIIAAMGRSGSTMLANWLCHPPGFLVFIEPFFLRSTNPRLLRIQLEDFGMPATDAEWRERDESGPERFRRLMQHRLAGRRWAIKEVLHEEHVKAIEAFRPPRVIVAVRNLQDIALSFFEKHRLQSNLDRFDEQWVAEYCLRESAAIVGLLDRLRNEGTPHAIVRYEDFTRSEAERQALTAFAGWPGGGTVSSHLGSFNRQFEVELHGHTISSRVREPADRSLAPADLALAKKIAETSENYQNCFGYR